jgi:oligoendopeptidase F
MSPYFPGVSSAEYREFHRALRADLASCRDALARLPADPAAAPAGWCDALTGLEAATARFAHLESYLECMGAADAVDEAVQRELGLLAELRAELEQAQVLLRARLRGLDDAQMQALVRQPALAPVAYFLSRQRRRAACAMAPELESLSTDLAVNGLHAWSRLYDRISGGLTFTMQRPGRAPETLPVAVSRTLLDDGDAEVRRAALAGANAAWAGVGETLAACLNAIAGTRLTLGRRAGIDDVLTPALLDAGMERATLDAMFAAVRQRQELGRRYLRLKARLLGVPRLGFQDQSAPLPGALDQPIPFAAARQQILRALDSYPAMAELARRAFDQRWIDHGVRPAKRPGGFCSSSPLLEQSRIFLTYNGTLGDVQTVAHELGHAFHSAVMVGMRPWSRHYPMTLAETASIFAQQLVTDAALAASESPRQRAVLLDVRLQEACAFLLNLPMRFDFEVAFYRERAGGELPVRRLCELMRETQLATYGDALDPDQLDPWFWASKLHFFLTDVSFYNFPYTFGFLFSAGIYARARREGAGFLATYEQLLRRTGSASVESIAAELLGVDLSQPEFWTGAIDGLERDLADLEQSAALFV